MSDVLKVGDICNIKTGKLDANQFVPGGIYPFFTCAPSPLTIDYYAFNDSVILIAGNNASGNFHINRFTGKFNAYQRTYILTAKSGYDLDYIYYSLQLELKRLKERAQGSQTKFLTMPILCAINIPKKDLTYQLKIASVLSSLDSKIDLNNRINAELEAMAKLLYDYWFVQFDFPNEEGKPYKASGGKMVWNEELKREIPEGWGVGEFSKLGNIIGGSTPQKNNPEFFSDNGISWITPKDLSLNTGNKFITKGEIDVSKEGFKAASLKLLPKGSVLLSSRAPIGYMAIATDTVTTNQGFKSFIPKSDYSTPFVYYTVKNALPEIINNASGSTFKEISGGTLNLIKVCLPDKKVIDSFTQKVIPIFEKQSILEQENKKLAELRDWLLPMLMNGQVKVREAEEEVGLAMATEEREEYKLGSTGLQIKLFDDF